MKRHRMQNRLCLFMAACLVIPMLGWVPKDNPDPSSPYTQPTSDTLNLAINDQTVTVSWQEYLTGVLAAEMPTSFEKEAKKAQVIASHSYALNRYPADGVIPTDPGVFEAYLTEDERKSRFGDQSDQIENELQEIVSEVLDQILVYDDQPIIAAFHAMSGGKTESSEDVWGSFVPYLTPADSYAETKLPNYETDLTLPPEEVKTALTAHLDDLSLGNDPQNWFSILSRTGSDYVDQIQVGNRTVKGTELRSLLGLPSADFAVRFENGQFVFSCKGKGHGVGMSQYGANELAKQGLTSEQILKHYYEGAELTSLSQAG